MMVSFPHQNHGANPKTRDKEYGAMKTSIYSDE